MIGSRASRILGVIPARGGSKGIPRKNLVELMGKPLVQYTFEVALASQKLDRVVLSTDDDEIAVFGRDFGVEVPFRRPKTLATDWVPCWDVVRHAVEWLGKAERYVADAVIVLQPTSPFRQTHHIDGAIEEFRKRKVDSVIGVCRVKEHPYEVVAFSGTRMRRVLVPAKPARRRQNYPEFFYINGAIYLIRREVLQTPGAGYGVRIWGYVMDYISSFEIDTPEDLGVAECLLRGGALQHRGDATESSRLRR